MSVSAKLWMEKYCPRNWTRVSPKEAETIHSTQQRETQHDGYLLECEIASRTANVVHLAPNHLWLKERLIKGWHIKRDYRAIKFDLESWIGARARQLGALQNFKEKKERHTEIEDNI